ncbi:MULTISPECIES: hotdog fold domain-containing protein [Acinetobacter]|uniref:hotdog fold domain-containing protein n=1 Tax=Acinetobacter TaxID=469 RepID=UPI000F747772|nr:hotdog fold domain-containing protein [Acinetobacter haemolyticus]RSN75158.1 DUF4442 domain-containing protein [Acinetobacter haemolyticus]
MTNIITSVLNQVKKKVTRQENYVLAAYEWLKPVPGGLRLLSKVVSRKAPYFQTVDPIIQKLERNYCEAIMSKTRTVENHIGTVHVIAICNGLEFVMGVLTEASIPAHLRWLPKGMQVNYVAKSNSDIKLIARVEDEWKAGDLNVTIEAYREDGTIVVQGTIMLWVTEKK